MNPQGMTIGPELAAALMRRRMGGMGGGNTAPAGQQVMAPNPMGGPLGASQTPLPTSPQPLQAGNLMPPSQDSQAAVMQQMMAQGGGQSPRAKLPRAKPAAAVPAAAAIQKNRS
jgi:hypothetical protein